MKIAMEELSKLPYITIYGSPDYKKHKGVLSFNIQDIHPHDVSSLVDYHGNIALRAGNHCAHPLLKYLNAQSTNRISFYFYNTKEDVYQFIEQIKKVRSYLGYDV
jgi:cysteine desulfurase/selenocysteine lyase